RRASGFSPDWSSDLCFSDLPAMIARRPRALAPAAYSNSTSGVRCADTTRTSCATPSCSSRAAACCMVSQSEREPMTMPTSGFATMAAPKAALQTGILAASPAWASAMDRKLLDILACPATRQPLSLLERAGLDALNQAIAAGGVRRADDTPQSEPLRE